MINAIECPPPEHVPVLVRFKDDPILISRPHKYYYVMERYGVEYVEADGEQYWSVPEEDIVGWISLDELDEILYGGDEE